MDEKPNPILLAYRAGRDDGASGAPVKQYEPGSLSQVAYNRGYREGADIANSAQIVARAWGMEKMR